MSSLTYKAMYDALVSILESTCCNIGSSYSSLLPSSIRTGNTALSCTIPRSEGAMPHNPGVGSNQSTGQNLNTGTGAVAWNIPAVVEESTFLSNLQNYLSEKGISYSSTSTVIPKYASYFINVASLFISSQIHQGFDISGNAYFFYIPASFPSVTETAPSISPIQKVDVDNCKNQFVDIIASSARPVDLLSGSFTASSSSSLFVAYFNLDN